MTEKTEAQIAAEAAAKEAKEAEKQAKKAAAEQAKQAKADERAAKKAQAEAAKEAGKAEREAAKQKKIDEKAAKAQAVIDAKAAKEQAKADAKAAKEAQRQPEQNGVRRPGPDGLCGKVWGLADLMSTELKQPVPVANLLERGVAEGLNASNIRTEYARWKKFHGLTGRIELPKAETQAAA